MEKANGSGHEASTAPLARIEAPVSLTPYQPRSYEEALAMATVFSKASSGELRISPEVAFLKMATGAELGIPATSALRMVDVADFGRGNQIGLRAQLMVGLCLRAKGICEYFEYVSGDDKACTYRTKRAGRDEQTEMYTIEQAKKAGLVKEKGAWEKDPASQLIARASSRLARRVYPDIIGNLYTLDELREAADSGDELPSRPAPVSPLRPAPSAPAGQKVVDAEFTEQPKPPAPSLEDFKKRMRAATSKQEGDAIGKEAAKVFEKGSADREALKAFMAERQAANWAPVAESGQEPEPAHDPVTGEVEGG